jgi:hypothetical protein
MKKTGDRHPFRNVVFWLRMNSPREMGCLSPVFFISPEVSNAIES